MTRFFSHLAFAVVLGASIQPALADKANDTLNIGWGGDGVMSSADAYHANTRTGIWFSQMVWDTLLYRDSDTGNYEGLLATDWHWVDDTTLELALRTDVKFTNGETFSADDVVGTFDSVLDPKSGAQPRTLFDWMASVEKVDDYTVRIHTQKPFPMALEYLATVLPIYPSDYYAKVGAEGMSSHPVGTGPYMVEEIKVGQEYKLVRNPDYTWGSPKGEAQIGHVDIRALPDMQTQLAELMSGGIDLTPDMSPDAVEKLEPLPNVEAALAETLRIYTIGFDVANPKTLDAVKDIRVRQAINYAIDRESIVDHLMNGAARVIYTPCHPAQFGCDAEAAKTYPFDPEKARTLLKEAGYGDGLNLTMYAEAPAREAEAIMADLKKVGIDVTLHRVPYEAYRKAQISGQAPAFLFNWGSYSLADANASVSFFFDGGGDDFTGDDKVIQWIKTADTSTDPETRKTNYAKAIARITEQAYWAPLYSGLRGYAWSPELEFKPHPDESLPVFDYRWK